jgi:hypothetical protein
MKKLEKEAKEYAKELIEARVIEDHQSGWMESVYLYITRNSKWVQAEIIKAQIIENGSMLEMLKLHGTASSRVRVSFRIEELKQQLKELEDESKIY